MFFNMNLTFEQILDIICKTLRQTFSRVPLFIRQNIEICRDVGLFTPMGNPNFNVRCFIRLQKVNS